MSTLTGNIQSLKMALDAAATKLQAAKDAYRDAYESRNEYQNEVNTLMSRGQDEEANNLSANFLAPANRLVDLRQISQNTAQAEYEAAQKIYTDALNTITPDQRNELDASNTATVTNAETARLNAEKALVAQGTTKYLIWGGVALLTVVIVIFGIIKFLKP